MPASTPTSMPAGFLHPREDLVTGGQPAPEDWARFAAAGVRSVVNLRPDAEMTDRDEAAEVAAAGLAYRQIPVDGSGDMTHAKAARLREALEALPSPVLVHCASGNRVGALLAIDAVDAGNMSPMEALQFGRDAGLKGGEGRVREVLGLHSAP